MPAPRPLWAAVLLATVCCLHGQDVKSTSSRPVTVAAIALSIRSRAIQDSRCYLMNGGAVESFFISEDTPVGAVIGTLSVNGDPREVDGNIGLSLQEKDAAVGIAPGTKNLTLLRVLDREEVVGPSNVYVNVRCDRRRTNDPSFIIPVSVRVWDVNDNAPTWVGAPYRARLSELTAPGSRILHTVRATDADQPTHATIHYSVQPGPHGEYFKFENELDSVLVLSKALDFESLPNFTVTLRAQDLGSPPLHSDTELHVQVLDADDQNPKFTHDSYTAILPDDAKEGDPLPTSPEPVSAHDQDSLSAPVHYSVWGRAEGAPHVSRDTGVLSVSAALLAADLPLTLVIKATQYDNPDRYALAPLTVSRRVPARGPVRFLGQLYSGTVPEDMPVGSVLLTLTTNHVKEKTPLQFFVSDRSFLEKFAINSAGELVLRRALDYEVQDQYNYQVMVTDGVNNDTSAVNLTVLNVNDWEPRFRYPQYEFQLPPPSGPPPSAGLLAVGRLDVHDGDRGDRVALSVRGPDASMFYMNNAGELFLRSEALSALNSSVISVTAVAEDSGVPPRQSSVPVLVHVPRVSRAAPRTGTAVVLAAGAAGLLLVGVAVLLLSLYLHKRPKPAPVKCPPPAKSSPPTKSGGVTSVPPEKLSGSLQSVSAGASTILAASSSSLEGTLQNNNNTSRQSSRFPKSRVAPLPPPLSSPGRPPPPSETEMSDHVGTTPSRSGVAWPANTIPARVKKLSWDDNTQQGEAEIHDATNPNLAEHMNLTVYF